MPHLVNLVSFSVLVTVDELLNAYATLPPRMRVSHLGCCMLARVHIPYRPSDERVLDIPTQAWHDTGM